MSSVRWSKTGTPNERTTWCRRPGRLPLAAAVLACLGSMLPLASATAHAQENARMLAPLSVVVLSNRADLISGGDALVEVRIPRGSDPNDLHVTLDGRDVTEAFAVRPNGHYQGLVAGLDNGHNELVATLDGAASARLTVTNHPQGGPVFAGPQLQPYICEPEQYGLEPAQNPGCNAPTRYDYFYKSTDTGKFEPYDPASAPVERLIAHTTTDEGKKVPFIVRRERGTVDRAVYDIVVLYNPDEDWAPWAPQSAWNEKLHMVFLGGASPWHRQGSESGSPVGNPLPNLLDVRAFSYASEFALSRGFAVATSSNTRVNDITAAETAMMVKEHLIETYGPIRYTTGVGCSGGSMSLQTVTNNYPGLLDGILPECSVVDQWDVIGNDFIEFPLLHRYFTNVASKLWSDPADRIAVYGTNGEGVPVQYGSGAFGAFTILEDPTVFCTSQTLDPEDEPSWVYSPSNPDGARCTVQDLEGQAFGYRESDGFANRPLDNMGVQYGLKPLLRGEISPAQFVDLNAKIGGRDIDAQWTPERTQADLDGLRNLYRSGRLNDGSQLDKVPMIDLRLGNQVGTSDVHLPVHTQITRARLAQANGHARNQIAWQSLDPGADVKMVNRAFVLLDRWLTAIEADKSAAPLVVKVLRHKPADAVDRCWPEASCPAWLQGYGVPRMVAGGPLASDIFKCQLKPIDWDDYENVEFTEEQKQQLRATFPHGVCDWTKPGVEQQSPAGVWMTYADTIGGRPLGPPPQSQVLR